MGLRDIETTLPPGFRFFPSDEELVCHYLYKKVTNEKVFEGTLVDVDLHTSEPWELPDEAKLSANEWYFFSFRDRKYSTGLRTNRSTKCGYWKATGKDRTVYEPSTQALVGMRKTLVFYRGRAPNGVKTEWVMHEFRLENPNVPPKEDWVLCRVFHKAKGDQRVKYSPDNEQDNIVGSSILHVDSSFLPPRMDQGMADGYEQQLAPNTPHATNRHREEMTCSQNGFLNLAMWQYGLLELPQETDSTPVVGDGSEEDYYGFLLDAGDHEDHSIGEVGMSSFWKK